MEKYITDTQLAEQTFLGLQPPEAIASMRGARPMRVNTRMKQHVNEKLYQAKTSFLDRIHQEIFEAKPQWEKDAVKADLERLARGEDEDGNKIVAESLEKPELTSDYLRSIGREDLIEWGSGRDE